MEKSEFPPVNPKVLNLLLQQAVSNQRIIDPPIPQGEMVVVSVNANQPQNYAFTGMVVNYRVHKEDKPYLPQYVVHYDILTPEGLLKDAHYGRVKTLEDKSLDPTFIHTKIKNLQKQLDRLTKIRDMLGSRTIGTL